MRGSAIERGNLHRAFRDLYGRSGFRNGYAECGSLDHSSQIRCLHPKMRGRLLVDPEQDISDFFKKLNDTPALLRCANSETTVRRNNHIFLATHQNGATFLASRYNISRTQIATADCNLGNAGAQYVHGPGALGERPLRGSCMSGTGRHDCYDRKKLFHFLDTNFFGSQNKPESYTVLQSSTNSPGTSVNGLRTT